MQSRTVNVMPLDWSVHAGNTWHTLWDIDLPESGARHGVYIIWNGEEILYVGQGDIGTRLSQHKNDKSFFHGASAPFCTWASVPAVIVDGVELYLGERLKPVLSKNFPRVAPVPVALPWQ